MNFQKQSQNEKNLHHTDTQTQYITYGKKEQKHIHTMFTNAKQNKFYFLSINDLI